MRFSSALYLMFLLVLFIGCQSDPEPPTSKKEAVQDSLSYNFSTIEKNRPCTDTASGDCINVKIEKISITAGSTEKVRQKIENYLNGQISATNNSDQSGQIPEEVANDLVNEYARILKEMPNYKSPWEYLRSFDVYVNRAGLFGVKLDAYSFTGGAHPASFEYYYNFDTDNGQLISVKNLILPKFFSHFRNRAEEQFRNSRNIDTATSYEDAGFWFENDEFTLPENFKYSPDHLLFVYNPYEIAPFSEGSVTIMFKYSDIRDWIKPEYRF